MQSWQHQQAQQVPVYHDLSTSGSLAESAQALDASAELDFLLFSPLPLPDYDSTATSNPECLFDLGGNMQDMSTAASSATALDFTATSHRAFGPTNGFSDLHFPSNVTTQHWNVSPTSSGSTNTTKQDLASGPTLFTQSLQQPSSLDPASAKRSATIRRAGSTARESIARGRPMTRRRQRSRW